MTYDEWKTSDPNDRYLGPEPELCTCIFSKPGRLCDCEEREPEDDND